MNCYFFITDINCLDYAKMAINSLLKTNPKSEILLYARNCNPEIQGITVIPIDNLEHLDYMIENIAVNALDLLGHRLKILDELKEKYNKIIMLDTDIIVLKSLEELFNLSDNYIYGRDELDDYKIFRNGLRNDLWFKTKMYLNSGALIIPSTVIRGRDLFKTFKTELKNRSFKYICPEQDFINFIFKDKLFNLGDTINQQVMSMTPVNPRVIHFAGPAKPLRTDKFFMKNCKWFYSVFEKHLELNKQSISREFYLRNKIALRTKKDSLYDR